MLRKSPKCKQIFKTAQAREELSNVSLLMDEPTRWSSTYYMLERFLSQKRAVKAACMDIDKLANRCLSPSEWDLLPSVS